MLSRTTTPLVLLDVTRLIGSAHRPFPTGIERVESAYAQWLLGEPSLDVRFVVTMGRRVRLLDDAYARPFLQRQALGWTNGAAPNTAASALRRVDRFLRADPSSAASGPGGLLRPAHQSPGHPDFQAAPGQPRRLQPIVDRVLSEWSHRSIDGFLKRVGRHRPIVYLRPSPDRLDTARPFLRMKRLADVKVINFCHDLIPLTHPEFVRAGTPETFARRIAVMAEVSDGIVVSSHHVARSLTERFPGLDMPLMKAPIGVDHVPPTPYDAPPDTPFFLVVSTIEARKNHAMLLHVWRRFASELGARAPKLVIVGRRGWEAHAPLAMLDRTEELRPLVYEAGAIPGGTLAALRRHALAVLMPSFEEGFGLPVVEALADDTPVIASNIPVFREIARETAELLDPLDGPAWARTIMDYAAPGSVRRAEAKARATAYRAPDWSDHFGAVRAFIDALVTRSPVATPLMTLSSVRTPQWLRYEQQRPA